jgi:translin
VESRHQAREQGLQACRKATQLCARAIRSLHRHEFDACRDLLTQAYREISHAREQLRPFPQIYYAGFLQDAEKELVEGETLYAIVLGDALPEPDELGVDVARLPSSCANKSKRATKREKRDSKPAAKRPNSAPVPFEACTATSSTPAATY